MRINHFLLAVIMGSLCLTSSTRALAELAQMTEWSESNTVMLPSKNGAIPATIRRLTFSWKWKLPKPNCESNTVAAVVVPSLNIYWLGYSGWMGDSNDRQFFVLANSIVGVSTGMNNALRFYVSTNQLQTTNELVHIKGVLKQKLDSFEASKFDISPIQFGMKNALGLFPFTGGPLGSHLNI